jgi:hypothetical protein
LLKIVATVAAGDGSPAEGEPEGPPPPTFEEMWFDDPIEVHCRAPVSTLEDQYSKAEDDEGSTDDSQSFQVVQNTSTSERKTILPQIEDDSKL